MMSPLVGYRAFSGVNTMRNKGTVGTCGDVSLRSKDSSIGGSGLSKSHISPQTIAAQLKVTSAKVEGIEKRVRRLQHELKIYSGGRIATIALRDKRCDAEFPEEQKQHKLYKRGCITKWSRKSQMRFKVSLAKLNQDKLGYGLEVCLTYPKKFPDQNEYKTYKRHLTRLNQVLVRRGYAGAWKLEFQKRGAPHYHIVLIPKKKLKGLSAFRKELASHWYRIVGSEDPKHLEAGTRVAPIESPAGMIGYMAQYMAKEDQTLPNNFTGRYWGFINKEGLPWSEEKVIPLGRENAQKIRRIFRKKIETEMRHYQMRIMTKILKRETGMVVSTQEMSSTLLRLGSKCKYKTSTDKKIEAIMERKWVTPPKKWRVRNNQTCRLFCNPDTVEKHLMCMFAREKRSLQNEGFLP